MRLNRAILPVLFLSGAAGLVHEVVWLRLFSLTFGNTAQAGAVVLGSFMGGLALGAWLFGRRAETSPRPYRLYGWLELGVAASAALLLAGYVGADRLYAAVFRAAGPDSPTLGVCRLAISLILMAAPCALMGGTLPVLVRAAAPAPEASGRRAGELYAINTFGAVAGALGAGFVSIANWGVWQTAFGAIGLNAAAGLLALGLAGREPALPSEPAADVSPDHARGEQRLALALAAVVGFYALALEVLYSRIVVFAVASTIYVWTLILAVYLVGLALGAASAARLSQRRPQPLADASRCLIAMAVSAWAYLAGIRWLDRQLIALIAYLGDAGLAHSRHLQMGLAALMLLPLALFSGAAFPFLVRAYTGDDTAAGRKTGALYAANTAAGVAGSLAAGFLFLPWIGAQWALFALTGLLLLAAGGTLIRAAPLRLDTATWIGAGVIAALAGAFLPGPRLLADLSLANFPSGYRALMTHEDVAATVMVLERRDNRIVTVNETPVAGMGDFMLRNTQILQGYIPLMAHPRPRRVAMIGFGAGETADVIASAQPEAFDLAELCPGVFKAAPFFQSINFGIERAPLPRQIIMDGKNYLKLTGHKYDIVMNDCVHPSYLGNASLYCRDHFEAGRRALADDGLMTSWLPIYELETLSVRSMINTFASVFPNCALLYAPTCFNFHALLIGRKQPGPILSLARSQQLLEREDVRRRLGQIDVDDPLDLINFVMLGPQGIAAHFGDAPIITDNHPSLEFDAARVPRQDHAYFWQNVRYLASLREDPLPYIDLAGAAQVETLLAAQPARYRATGTMLEVIGDNDLYPGQAEAIVDEAVALSPGLAGSAAMKTQIRSNLARGRQAPMVCGSRGRQEQAEALLQAGQFDRAAAVLEAEVRKNPANFKAVGTLGMARLRQGDIAGGAKLFDQVLAVNPNDALAFWHLGEIAARKHDWPKAEERYRRALELFGPAPGLYGELGQVRRSVGDPAGAIEWFREGIRRFPNEVSLLLAYAETLYDLGQAPEAAQAAQRALELNPSDWRAREMLRQMTAAGAPAP